MFSLAPRDANRKRDTEPLQKGRGPRAGWRAEEEGDEKRVRCVMYMYRLPARNVTIIYCKQMLMVNDVGTLLG